MNQQFKLQHQIALIYRYFQWFLCGCSDNFNIFNLSALGREILITVKTKICPVHYFGCIHPTGKNDTLNELAAQTITSDNIDLQILFNSFCVVAETILTFSTCRHWAVKF